MSRCAQGLLCPEHYATALDVLLTAMLLLDTWHKLSRSHSLTHSLTHSLSLTHTHTHTHTHTGFKCFIQKAGNWDLITKAHYKLIKDDCHKVISLFLAPLDLDFFFFVLALSHWNSLSHSVCSVLVPLYGHKMLFFLPNHMYPVFVWVFCFLVSFDFTTFGCPWADRPSTHYL